MATGQPVSIDMTLMILEMETRGVPLACASCTNYWDGKLLGLPGCRIPGECGSPLVGDVFGQYNGPLTDDHLRDACYHCGGEGCVSIRVTGKRRLLNLCMEHFDTFLRMCPVGLKGEALAAWKQREQRIVLTFPGGRVMSVAEYRKLPRKKSVVEQIAELNAYQDEEDARAARKK